MFNRTIAENYLNISNKDSFFGHYKVIKYSRAKSTMGFMSNLITPRPILITS